MSDVCIPESNVWRECLENTNYGVYPTRPCSDEESTFMQCMESWRSKSPENRAMKIRGKAQGESGPQCRIMACNWESCMQENKLNGKPCKFLMEAFNRCVNATFLSEW
eukprot:PhF_6_TR34562/c0_g1_i1/m.50355